MAVTYVCSSGENVTFVINESHPDYRYYERLFSLDHMPNGYSRVSDNIITYLSWPNSPPVEIAREHQTIAEKEES